jgi:hypothetical protein
MLPCRRSMAAHTTASFPCRAPVSRRAVPFPHRAVPHRAAVSCPRAAALEQQQRGCVDGRELRPRAGAGELQDERRAMQTGASTRSDVPDMSLLTTEVPYHVGRGRRRRRVSSVSTKCYKSISEMLHMLQRQYTNVASICFQVFRVF